MIRHHAGNRKKRLVDVIRDKPRAVLGPVYRPLRPTETLPVEYWKPWSSWRNSLRHLTYLKIRRTYASASLQHYSEREVHIFSDASEKAIATVAYLRVPNSSGEREIGFSLAKAKVAPTHSHTSPRLERCAAVLATEIAETLNDHLDIPVDRVKLYTYSQIVLGYIYNRTRGFYTYVSNRVENILKITNPEQWNYIRTDQNPADCATRCVPAENMRESPWLLGPSCLLTDIDPDESYSLINPDKDKEASKIRH